MPKHPPEDINEREQTALCWDLSLQPGAATVPLKLFADRQLQLAANAADSWRSTGEQPRFLTQAPLLLPAGWYEIHGRLESSDGSLLTPCLYPGYTRGMDGDTQIRLPDPASNDGTMDALLLLKYDVSQLQFSPGRGPSRFRVGNFQLRRVSRTRALLRMLRPVPGEIKGVSATARRGLRFALRGLGGISEATTQLFGDYQRRLHPHDVSDYQTWVQHFDSLGEEHLDLMRERAEKLCSNAPLISVLLPVYQTPTRWLRRCLDSVINQVYPNWQLCIADDASPDPKVMALLCEYAEREPRITLIQREVNGHISAASNSALTLSRGEFVALLDHDDELRPHALLTMAEAIMREPGLQLLYSDEDKIDADGRRFDPYFKPDWDPDLLRSQNYLCHLTVIRSELVRAAGGFREGFEGSQDHDLVLRCSERLGPQQIRHIPHVLYHWRAIPGSTALSRDAKDYASSAGVRAVADHLARCATGARAEELSHGHYRVHWPLPASQPMVSLIIPTRDKVELLRKCVDSILQRSRYRNFEIVVVDNGSSDIEALAYLTELESLDRVQVLRYRAPFNYSAINNWAVARCKSELIGLVNNDIEVISPDWLEEMSAHAMRPEVGAVGAMLYYPNDTIQHAGVVLGIHGVAAHIYAGLPRGYPGHGGRVRVTQSLSAVTGACLLMRREVYNHVGGLDEQLAVAFNDIDLCLRLRKAGFRNIWTPFAELYHHESASRGSEDTEEKKLRFAGEVETMRQRWGECLHTDPAYNLNLSLNSRNFELASPPRHGSKAFGEG